MGDQQVVDPNNHSTTNQGEIHENDSNHALLEISCDDEEDELSASQFTNADNVKKDGSMPEESEFIDEIHKNICEKWEITSEEFNAEFLENKSSSANDCANSEVHKEKVIALTHWITICMTYFMCAVNLTNNSVEAFLQLLKGVLIACARICPVLAPLINMCPSTFYQLLSATNNVKDRFLKHVVCPKCHSVFDYSECILIESGKNVSKTCDYVEFPLHRHASKRQKCGTILLKDVILKNEKRTLCPRKMYCMKPIKQWLIEFLDRPTFYDDCEKWRNRNDEVGYYRDMYDGRVWKGFMKYKGQPFLEEPGRYGIIMNVDWYQCFKHSSYSVGVIYACIINLPREIRYRKENVMVLGIIPGPSEPNAQQLQFYLEPIVDELIELWDGFSYKPPSRTEELTFRVALLCTASDIPATRKLGGFLGHSARRGCSKCKKEFKIRKFRHIKVFFKLVVSFEYMLTLFSAVILCA